jgi:FixJ family two-component response regulator
MPGISAERAAARSQHSPIRGCDRDKLNKQVAFDLGLSGITAKTYRGGVMQKMAAADVLRISYAWQTS